MSALAIIKRAELVAEGRSWLRTPFRHQARVKGAGVDCANLIIAVGEVCGVLALDPNLWRRYEGYGRLPNPRRMREALATFLHSIAAGDAGDGDVAWLQWRKDLPMHLAIAATFDGRRTIIHAYAGVKEVVEHGLTAEWENRIESWWRYPGLTELLAREAA
jgi:NlpC/P60 family putative phage cell wall peptidase